MALILDRPIQGPATHALVIGVGGYDYLPGGSSDRKMPRATRFGNIGQLTSPPRSARAFARFLTTSRVDDWAAPLSTVDLLISTAPGDDGFSAKSEQYERPTRQAIQDAFDRWWVRCDTADGTNIAIFYFCGHGLQATNQILLASDVGSTGNPWMHAFDLNKTRQAFRANRAKTQMFFVDACREVTTSTIEVPDPAAPALREPEQRQVEHCEHDLTIQATAGTKKAYGPERQISYFTEALLRAFAGGAAGRQGGRWWVRSDLIASRIGDLVRLAGGTEQRPVPTIQAPVTLYQLDCIPEVSLEFGCDPAEATSMAELAYARLMDGPRQQRPHRKAIPWRLSVPAGVYKLEAAFPDRTFRDAAIAVPVESPLNIEMLSVR
jgi:Caspase domain